MQVRTTGQFPKATLFLALSAALLLVACGGGSMNVSGADVLTPAADVEASSSSSASSVSSASSASSASSSAASSVAARLPKNVILMITDGASWGTWDMSAHWQGVASASELGAYRDLPVRMGMTTYPLNTSSTATGNETPTITYDASSAWNTTLLEPENNKYAAAFAGYQYLRKNYTDSAAAGTALASGVKTYNSAINYNNLGTAVPFITQLARQAGKSTGVVSTVQLSHATPAAFSAQRASRSNLPALAAEQLRNGVADLLMAPGHPGYDSNGIDLSKLDAEACAAMSQCRSRYNTIAEAEWTELAAGTLTPAGAKSPWMLIEKKSDFEALAEGRLKVSGPLAAIPRVRTTLQQARTLAVQGEDATRPSGVKMIGSVPDLPTMSRGALNYLAQNDKGFFVMIEGGAVDWAAHANQADRMIEEQVDFDRAVEAVKAWVEEHSNWDDTLLIITTDHGNALPLSPESASIAFDPVKNPGKGKLPQVKFWSDNHTNEVVRLWARGAGAEAFLGQVRGHDPKFASHVGHNTDGAYVDNVDVFTVMKKAMGLN